MLGARPIYSSHSGHPLSLPLSLKLGVSRKQEPSYQASTGRVEPLRPMILMTRPDTAPLCKKIFLMSLKLTLCNLTVLRRRVRIRLTACMTACSVASLCRVGRSGWRWDLMSSPERGHRSTSSLVLLVTQLQPAGGERAGYSLYRDILRSTLSTRRDTQTLCY